MSYHQYSPVVLFKLNDVQYSLHEHQLKKCAIFQAFEDVGKSESSMLELAYDFNAGLSKSDPDYSDKKNIKQIIDIGFDCVKKKYLRTIIVQKLNLPIVTFWKVLSFMAYLGIKDSRMETFIELIIKNNNLEKNIFINMIHETSRICFMDVKEFFVRTILKNKTEADIKSLGEIGALMIIHNEYMSNILKLLLTEYVYVYCGRLRKETIYPYRNKDVNICDRINSLLPSEAIRAIEEDDICKNIVTFYHIFSRNMFNLCNSYVQSAPFKSLIISLSILVNDIEDKYSIIIGHKGTKWYADIENTNLVTILMRLCMEIVQEKYVLLRKIDNIDIGAGYRIVQVYPTYTKNLEKMHIF